MSAANENLPFTVEAALDYYMNFFKQFSNSFICIESLNSDDF